MLRLRFASGSACLLLLLATSLLPAHARLASGVRGERQGDVLSLSNDVISATWSVRDGTLRWQSLANRLTGKILPIDGSPFELVPKAGAVLHSQDFKLIADPSIEDIPNPANSSRAADHLLGRQIRIELEDSSRKIRVTWKAMLREHANYVREEVTIHAAEQPLALSQIALIDAVLPGTVVSGHAKGSPVTAGTWFLGFEHPLSECRVRADRASCWLSRELPIQPGQSVTYSAVFGAAHPGQLRRDFLAYLELERAHPYRTFLHYNSWYDLGYVDRYNEQEAVTEINRFGEQLTKHRGVK